MARKKNTGDSVGGVFRKIFNENPPLLKTKSNNQVLSLYRVALGLAPDADVEKRIKAIMANVKSVMRKNARKRGRPAGMKIAASTTAPRTPIGRLEQLEEMIDDCLTLAKTLDRDGLEGVIKSLRHARNQVVWKTGQ